MASPAAPPGRKDRKTTTARQAHRRTPVNEAPSRDMTVAGIALRFGIVALTLGTAYIHSTLGGLLFTLNATGYVVAAIAMIAPISLAIRFRWVVRLGLMGYAATAIAMWAIQGPYYSTAYVAKGIEVALITLLVIDFLRADGNPVTVVRRELAAGLAWVNSRRAHGAAAA